MRSVFKSYGSCNQVVDLSKHCSRNFREIAYRTKFDRYKWIFLPEYYIPLTRQSATMALSVKYSLCFCITVLTLGLCEGTPHFDTRQVECDNRGYLCFRRGDTPFVCASENFKCCSGPLEGQFAAVPAQTGFECCEGSGELYDVTREVCLNGSARPKLTPSEEMCGLTASYDSETQKCCKKNDTYGRVYSKGGECCNESYITDPTIGCCEVHIYNRSHQTCCKSNYGSYVLHNTPNGACCLNVPYDPTTQKCSLDVEEGVISKNEHEISRCDGEPYNPDTHLCCVDKIAPRTGFLCYKDGSLVDKTPYLYHNEICRVRGNKLQTYYSGPDSRTDCIEGDRILHLLEDQEVCRGAPGNVYNTTEDLCCAGEIFHKHGKSNRMKCCATGTEAYNPDRQICCPGNRISEVPENNGGKCCGKKGYNSRVQRCTNSRIVEDECADESKPPFSERCDLLVPQIRELAKAFHKGGLFVYIATVVGAPVARRRGKKAFRTWRLRDVEQIVKSKKKKVKLTSVKGRNQMISAEKCRCPYELISGDRYIFWTERPLKRKSILNTKEIDVNKATDAVMSLSQAENLGRMMEIFFSTD